MGHTPTPSHFPATFKEGEGLGRGGGGSGGQPKGGWLLDPNRCGLK